MNKTKLDYEIVSKTRNVKPRVKDVEEDKFKTIQTSEKLELINIEYDEQKRIGKITIKGTQI